MAMGSARAPAGRLKNLTGAERAPGVKTKVGDTKQGGERVHCSGPIPGELVAGGQEDLCAAHTPSSCHWCGVGRSAGDSIVAARRRFYNPLTLAERCSNKNLEHSGIFQVTTSRARFDEYLNHGNGMRT